MPKAMEDPAPVRYRVAMPEPVSHELHVRMDVPPLPDRAEVDLVLPAWAPGSYMVRDFARNVYDLAIVDGRGRPLPVRRLDKQRWRVRTGGAALRAVYRVFAFEQSVRTSYLDDAHAFWNGTSIFLFVEGEKARPCVVQVQSPRGWRVATALSPVSAGRNLYRADDYDQLADSPFEVGPHELASFAVGSTGFEVVLHGRCNAEVPRLLADLRRICVATGRMFGGFPFERYLFIIHALPARGGGLEHASSTTLDIAGLSFEDERGYQQFAELAAHEFFHAWNVKRIHDKVLGPFDYTRENYTRLLWFHEGFTEYMQSIVLLRAGLLPVKQYLDELADGWTRYLARPGRNVTPLSELSFEAWIKQYRPAENHVNRMVSYYDKGKWAALVLELILREATGGRRGLAELFRRLWERHGRVNRGLDAGELRAEVEELAGRSVRGYFARYIDGTQELPVPAALRRAGIEARRRPSWAREDDPTHGWRMRGWSGLSFGPGERAVVRNVIPESPAWLAGLTYSDEVVAIDGNRVNGMTVTRRLADRGPGQAVEVSFFRQEVLRSASLILVESPETTWEFALAGAPNARASAVRRGWLGI